MIMGAALSLIVFSIKSKYKKLMQSGEKVEGTLQGYESVKIKNRDMNAPVVSFVTRAGKAFTQRTEDSFFPANARRGAKVVVFYNPDNPAECMIQGKKFAVMYFAVFIGGIIFFLTGLALLLNYSGLIHILKK
jgi:hypothetical protein